MPFNSIFFVIFLIYSFYFFLPILSIDIKNHYLLLKIEKHLNFKLKLVNFILCYNNYMHFIVLCLNFVFDHLYFELQLCITYFAIPFINLMLSKYQLPILFLLFLLWALLFNIKNINFNLFNKSKLTFIVIVTYTFLKD